MQTYSIVNTKYGKTLVATKGNALIAFLFLAGDEAKMMKLFHSKFPNAQKSDAEHFMAIAEAVLKNQHIEFEFNGTEFQKSVWNELLKTKSITSYQELATRIGRSTAVRAVANAVANNLLHILVPCHLIVRSGGEVGKYAGGIEIKQALLAQLPK